MSILTPEVRAIIAESVRTAPELSPEQRRALARIWGPAARRACRETAARRRRGRAPT